MTSGNIASGLSAMAALRPDALAALAPAGRDPSGRARHVHLTFRQLDRESDRLAAGLQQMGIGPGVRTVLMVRPGLDFFELTFALFKAGAVPVLVDPGLGIKNLGRSLVQAAPEAFVGIPAAQWARIALGWGKETIQRVVTVARSSRLGTTSDQLKEIGGDRNWVRSVTEPEQMAAILFTSGSTGAPKGAVYTHAIFHAQVDLLRRTYAIEPGEVDLCTFPLFALFGPILGMTCVVPEMDATRPARANPRKIIEAIEDFGVTNLFGSPALIRRVGDYGVSHGVKLPSLRRVISAGAPVPARVLETFAKLLEPGVPIFTPYGATESLPVASIGSDEILGETRHATDRGAGVCVGRPVEGMRVELIAIQDEPISTWSDDLLVPDGQPGEIVVRGPVVTRSYFRRDEATALAKIEDPATGGFWHRMGDLGRRDATGRIWFLGRKAHRVQTPAGTLFTIPVEGVFNVHPDVARTALVGVSLPGKTNPTGLDGSRETKPIVCVEPKRRLGRAGWAKLRDELRALAKTNPITSGVETFLLHPSFPVDIRHNAKIFREKLATWAARRTQ
jgi:acyl-CoA synthetase (AMP-forming)/AMP-acid ligase II